MRRRSKTTDLLTELDATRKSETDALRETVAAKNEAISAKDAVIVSQDKLIEALKKKKSSPWKTIGRCIDRSGVDHDFEIGNMNHDIETSN